MNKVLQYSNSTTPIKTSVLGTITKASLSQANKQSLVVNPYTISFTTANPIPKAGIIQLSWPPQISLSSNFTCIVTDAKTHTEHCKVDTLNKMILIQDSFNETDNSTGYSGVVTIQLNDVMNPQTNQLGTGFQIRTYADAEMKYGIDLLDNTLLIPRLDCNFPCKSCSLTDPDVCTSCWLLPDIK